MKEKCDWEELKNKAIKEKEEELGKIIPLSERIKKDEKKRAILAAALLEDEAVRLASTKNCEVHLKEKEEEDKRTPFWMFCVLYFILGMLSMITFDSIFYGGKGFIELFLK